MKPTAADARAVPALVERFERALGPAVTTPEHLTDSNGRQVRARIRVWRWDCPCCPADETNPDADRSRRSLFIDSDGRVGCEACHATGDQIGREVRIKLEAINLLEGLGIL
jgi:hypothetical protein